MPYRIIEENVKGIQGFEGRREQDSKQQTVFASLFAIAPVQERTSGQMADAISDMQKNERRLILLWIQGQFIQYMKMEKIFIFTQNMLVVLVIHLRRLIT